MVTARERDPVGGGGGGVGGSKRESVTAGHVSMSRLLSTLSREVNVALLYRRYFEKEPVLRLYLNFYDY